MGFVVNLTQPYRLLPKSYQTGNGVASLSWRWRWIKQFGDAVAMDSRPLVPIQLVVEGNNTLEARDIVVSLMAEAWGWRSGRKLPMWSTVTSMFKVKLYAIKYSLITYVCEFNLSIHAFLLCIISNKVEERCSTSLTVTHQIFILFILVFYWDQVKKLTFFFDIIVIIFERP